MTISDVFEAPVALTAPEKGGRERGRAPAKDMVTDGDVLVASRARRIKDTVLADVRGAWLWDAHGLTLRSLWDQRLPAIERVPAENRALRGAWVAYNHTVLAVIVPALFVLYLLGHPARFLLAAAVAAPVLAIWLN